MTIQQAKEWLEYSPKEAGPIAPGLLGWVFVEDTGTDARMCSHCAGRLAGRGISVPSKAAPIWAPNKFGGCDICNH